MARQDGYTGDHGQDYSGNDQDYGGNSEDYSYEPAEGDEFTDQYCQYCQQWLPYEDNTAYYDDGEPYGNNGDFTQGLPYNGENYDYEPAQGDGSADQYCQYCQQWLLYEDNTAYDDSGEQYGNNGDFADRDPSYNGHPSLGLPDTTEPDDTDKVAAQQLQDELDASIAHNNTTVGETELWVLLKLVADYLLQPNVDNNAVTAALTTIVDADENPIKKLRPDLSAAETLSGEPELVVRGVKLVGQQIQEYEKLMANLAKEKEKLDLANHAIKVLTKWKEWDRAEEEEEAFFKPAVGISLVDIEGIIQTIEEVLFNDL